MLIHYFLKPWALALLLAPLAVQAADSSALTVGALPHDPTVLVAGSMPYSNQWTFDEPDSFLYISRSQLSLNANSLRFAQLESRFTGNTGAFYGCDYFSRITWLKDRESDSWLRQLAINGRYGIGALIKRGYLARPDYTIDNNTENAYLSGLRARLGLNLSWEYFWWFRPFVSIDASPIVYRHSSSLSGAEIQGGALYWGNGIGAHFPVLIKNQGTLFAELRKDRQLSDHNKIFKGDTSIDAGVGLVF